MHHNEIECTEKAACGVGFITSRKGISNHEHLQQALHALRCVEHRGACAVDQISSDGAGIMTDIPFELFGFEKGTMAVMTLFLPSDPERLRIILKMLAETFDFMGLKIESYRDVPIDPSVLGPEALSTLPVIKQAFIARPSHCRTDASFNALLFHAKQRMRLRTRGEGIFSEYFFTSISSNTIVYKALTKSDALDKFYLDLQNPKFKTRFALFHRRFSTNTRTSWDKAQPFRIIAHNGEINTIAGNRSSAASREKSLGLIPNELITHHGISDSGNLNEMVEALHYRSSLARIEDILAIMVPPADVRNNYYKFWRRAMEPWDGPASLVFSDGITIGARLDRNGFRPARWMMTEDHFYLSSEAGAFEVDQEQIISKGALHAGRCVNVDMEKGFVEFKDPSESRENEGAHFDPRLIEPNPVLTQTEPTALDRKGLFGYTEEDMQKMLIPMITSGKEPIGSMGDTARMAILSDQPRPFFDYFYQKFAQVTNPPVDFIRESIVTNLKVYLGKRPNIFAPKELIPPPPAIELDSPVFSLATMDYLRTYETDEVGHEQLALKELDISFRRDEGIVGLRSKLSDLAKEVVSAASKGYSIIVLSDRKADYKNPPIPSLLALRKVVNALNNAGVRLQATIVMHTAEVRNTHQLAALISFGAAAVCPYLALEIARYEANPDLDKLSPDQKEKNLVKALDAGLLKVMAKMGISVARSYQSAKLFSAIGIGDTLIKEFFPGASSLMGGIELDDLVEDILKRTEEAERLAKTGKLFNTYQFKEDNKGIEGEKHYMTSARAKVVHNLVRDENFKPDPENKVYKEYLRLGENSEPVAIRHLFDLKKAEKPKSLKKVEAWDAITKRFGTGGMSFGAINAESQRDLILAMREIGGRSNSGEGGENPFYYTDGVTSTTKQVASGRFGVTAEYLKAADEIQIKVSQGAKPGEGGQLMSVKVDEHIARARHALPGIDLISPPPMHDIYSIEDLKELIYELKQLHPAAKINVKLTSGEGIGTVAVGVAKAGADSIHIGGGDGGTGAASLTSMKHAGLPWEIGLAQVHRTLVENGLRKSVTLRTDGGLLTGKDIIVAAILGADEYDFGKLLLVAEGCIMARICEKNTCPTGIATHDPKFKAKYKGHKDHVVRMMQILAEDVRRHLSELGVGTIDEIIGRTDLICTNERHIELINRRKLNLSYFFGSPMPEYRSAENAYHEGTSSLNQEVLQKTKEAVEKNIDAEFSWNINTTDRAAMATLSGVLAMKGSRYSQNTASGKKEELFKGKLKIDFNGSAGQGFGVFMTNGLQVRLFGEANDSVCKSMSGGKMTICPPHNVKFRPEENAIIGNCALYGATGGTLYVNGLAGDRFAVRNSGALAVVEGAGLHACEYMTNGCIVILGKTSHNLGAGMTGGKLYLYGDQEPSVNKEYIVGFALTGEDAAELKAILEDYLSETDSNTARFILKHWDSARDSFKKYIPIGIAKKLEAKQAEGTDTLKLLKRA
ncbi:MAG: glutamate synthase large subunit [Chlorobiales bacterium]|nr:glutamate synthase large subunit [Chlorobiales bacterium]